MRAVLKCYGSCDRWLTVAKAAELASMPVRSFQRKLASDGVVFSELVDQAPEIMTKALSFPVFWEFLRWGMHLIDVRFFERNSC